MFKKKIKELFIILIRNEESSHSIPSAPTHSVQLWLCDKQLVMSKKPTGLRLAAGDGMGSGSLLQECGSKSCSSISFASLLPVRRCASLCHLLTGLTLCFLLDLFRSHSTRVALTLATAFRSH